LNAWAQPYGYIAIDQENKKIRTDIYYDIKNMTNPQSELLKKISRETEEYIKSKDQLKNNIAMSKMGQLAFTTNTSNLFAPVTKASENQSKTLQTIIDKQDEQKQDIQSNDSQIPTIIKTNETEVRIPNDDIQNAINEYFAMPLKKKTTANSSDTTTMKVSGKQTNNSPLYKLNGKNFSISIKINFYKLIKQQEKYLNYIQSLQI